MDGIQPTGRQLSGPLAELVEIRDADGALRTLLVFRPPYRERPELEWAARHAEQALPVTGIAPLETFEQGCYLLRTGPILSLAELLTRARREPGLLGPRAVVELLHGALGSLRTAHRRRRRAHGSLTPWRLALQPKGKVVVLAHGLPDIDPVLQQEDARHVPAADVLRYAPPERLRGEPEQLASDVYALATIAYECLTLRPLFGGLPDETRARILRGEVASALHRHRDSIPEHLAQLLREALRGRPELRISAEDFEAQLAHLLAHGRLPGKRLSELLRAQAPRPEAMKTVHTEAASIPEPSRPEPSRATPLHLQSVGTTFEASELVVEAPPRDEPVYLERRRGGEARPVQLRLPGRGERKVYVRDTDLVCEAAALVSRTMIAPELDLEGRLVRAWRLGDARGPLPGDRPLRRVDLRSGLELYEVHADTRLLVLEDGEELEVSTLLPLASVLGWLRRSGKLSSEARELQVDGRRRPQQLLVEELAEGSTLSVD